jgi:hypothetical protein
MHMLLVRKPQQDTPARKALRQQQMKSLQQTRYHTPLTQPRVRPSSSETTSDDLGISVKQQLQFCEDSEPEDQHEAGKCTHWSAVHYDSPQHAKRIDMLNRSADSSTPIRSHVKAGRRASFKYVLNTTRLHLGSCLNWQRAAQG